MWHPCTYIVDHASEHIQEDYSDTSIKLLSRARAFSLALSLTHTHIFSSSLSL